MSTLSDFLFNLFHSFSSSLTHALHMAEATGAIVLLLGVLFIVAWMRFFNTPAWQAMRDEEDRVEADAVCTPAEFESWSREVENELT